MSDTSASNLERETIQTVSEGEFQFLHASNTHPSDCPVLECVFTSRSSEFQIRWTDSTMFITTLGPPSKELVDSICSIGTMARIVFVRETAPDSQRIKDALMSITTSDTIDNVPSTADFLRACTIERQTRLLRQFDNIGNAAQYADPTRRKRVAHRK
jgi:hypothetical protein